MKFLAGAMLATMTAAIDPADPPFESDKVLFSGVFSDHVVLQRAPQHATVFGTAAPGATITVAVSNEALKYTYTVETAVAVSSDTAIHGTWKTLLPPRPAGLGYTIEARCDTCVNQTAATLVDVAMGDVWLCSGQSNMEDPVLTTVSRNVSYDAVANGGYDHIRLFQGACASVSMK
jgi:sialate O-acetylesterase